MTASDPSDNPANEVTCVLSLSGKNFDPARAAERLPQSKVWRRRKARIVGDIDLPDAAVEVSLGPEEHMSLDSAASALLGELRGHEDTIRQLAAEYALSVALTCLVRVYTDPPSYDFSAEVIGALAALKAKLSLDIIDLRD